MEKTYAIVPAAGRGVRMGGDRPKQFLGLSDRPILLHTVYALAKAPFILGIFLVLPEGFIDEAKTMLEGFDCLPVVLVPGGAERQDSVFNGLRYLPPDCGWVVVHDGVRPFVTARLLAETWEAAHETGASIAALPATDTVKRVRGGCVSETVPRGEVWLVQTPQVFRKDLLVEAYRQAREQGWSGTDDASFVERAGGRVAVVTGERTNIKVTTPEDLDWAAWLMGRDRLGPASGERKQ